MNTRLGSLASRTARSNSRAASETGVAVDPHLPRAPVDDELADLEHLGRPCRGAPQHRPDPRHELGVELALGDVVRPALERPHALDGIGAGGREHDHRDVAVPAPPGLALAQPLAELRVAREHDVRARPLDDVERLRAPPRLDHVEAVGAQVALEVARARAGRDRRGEGQHAWLPRLERPPARHQLSIGADL